MNLFFYSDPHFGHKNIIKYCNRPFSSVEEMDEELIHRYNEVVGEEDTVIWLGDCFFYQKSRKIKEIMRRLNGDKRLVLGNHDSPPHKMLAYGFCEVSHELWMRMPNLNLPNVRLQLKHYPFKPSTFKYLYMSALKRWFSAKHDIRFFDRRPKDIGQYLIHGHTHQKTTFEGRSIHVGVDSNDYRPIPWSVIANYIRERETK